jgi:cell division transport system permease protein
MSSRLLAQHLVRSWRHHFPLQATTVLVLSLVLIVLSMILGVRENLNRLNSVWGDNLELTIYFKEGASAESVNNFIHKLNLESEFSQVKFVGKDEAAKRFVSRMGYLAPDFLKSADFENPLPASVELKLKENRSVKEKIGHLRTLAERFATNQVVDDVAYGQGWIENWAGFLTSIHMMSGAAVFLTMLLGFLVIGNSVRVSLSQRRDEIEIMELVGATTRWIRIPYIMEGAVLGLLASSIAGAAGYAIQSLLFTYLRRSLSFWSVLEELRPLSVNGFISLASVGTAFGAIGAYICVRHINNGWSAAERWDV